MIKTNAKIHFIAPILFGVLTACMGPDTQNLSKPSVIPSEITHQSKAYDDATDLRVGANQPRDYKEAVRILRTLADRENDSRAMNDLGIMYAKGQGVSRNYQEAAEWFFRGAEHNNSSARYNLALMRLHGVGLSQDTDEATRLLINAASQGNVHAQALAAELFESSAFSTLNEESKRLYHRASEGGDLENWRFIKRTEEGKWLSDVKTRPRNIDRLISDMLVDAYFTPHPEGNVNQKDIMKRELYSLRERARNGDEVAQYNLAVRYLKGDGVPPDASEGARWMTVSAEAGYSQAQYHLGLMYLNGNIVAHNPIYAHHWLHIASTTGHGDVTKKSTRSLTDLERQMSKSDILAAQDFTKQWRSNKRVKPVW